MNPGAGDKVGHYTDCVTVKLADGRVILQARPHFNTFDKIWTFTVDLKKSTRFFSFHLAKCLWFTCKKNRYRTKFYLFVGKLRET